jgi:hypothetical protein
MQYAYRRGLLLADNKPLYRIGGKYLTSIYGDPNTLVVIYTNSMVNNFVYLKNLELSARYYNDPKDTRELIKIKSRIETI